MVASEPIAAWKMLTKNNRSLYCDFQYFPNKKYDSAALIVNNYIVQEGFHAYRSKETAINLQGAVSRIKDKSKVAMFIIPRGASYYLGIGNEIVSDSIVSGYL